MILAVGLIILAQVTGGTSSVAKLGSGSGSSDPSGAATTATDNQTIVSNGTNFEAKTIPDCDDSAGNHLNFDQTGNTFSCGTTIPATVALLESANTLTAQNTFGSAPAAANAVELNETAGCITFEGSSADGIETRICVVNPTISDTTINFPTLATSGTVAMASASNTWSATQVFSSTFQGYTSVEAITTTKTTTVAEGLETYTNTGDTDGATITLLNDPSAGAMWRFAVTVAQTLTIVPSTGETLYMGTDQCNVSMTSSSIGATVEIRAVVGGSGGVYMAFGASGWTCND
jgi:hypothetical protein